MHGVSLDTGAVVRPCQTYESNVLFVMRYMVDNDIVGASWVELPCGSYSVVTVCVCLFVFLCVCVFGVPDVYGVVLHVHDPHTLQSGCLYTTTHIHTYTHMKQQHTYKGGGTSPQHMSDRGACALQGHYPTCSRGGVVTTGTPTYIECGY